MFEEKFEPYFRDRMICNKNGYCVIIPKDSPQPIPINCPVCDFLLRSKDDENSWYKYNCCERCSTYWAIPRKSEWDTGWRPGIEDLQKEIARRPPIAVDIKIE